jgi:hypothetical protein
MRLICGQPLHSIKIEAPKKKTMKQLLMTLFFFCFMHCYAQNDPNAQLKTYLGVSKLLLNDFTEVSTINKKLAHIDRIQTNAYKLMLLKDVKYQSKYGIKYTCVFSSMLIGRSILLKVDTSYLFPTGEDFRSDFLRKLNTDSTVQVFKTTKIMASAGLQVSKTLFQKKDHDLHVTVFSDLNINLRTASGSTVKNPVGLPDTSGNVIIVSWFFDESAPYDIEEIYIDPVWIPSIGLSISYSYKKKLKLFYAYNYSSKEYSMTRIVANRDQNKFLFKGIDTLNYFELGLMIFL